MEWGKISSPGKIKEEALVKLLIDLLKDEPFPMIFILGILRSEKAVESLINILKDKNENTDIRSMAASALCFTKSEITVQPLIDALKDENFSVRHAAASALGSLKSEKAVQPLIDLLKDEKEFVRLGSAIALRRIVTAKNKKQLEDLLKSEHEFSINRAFEILSGIEKVEKSKTILFENKMSS